MYIFRFLLGKFRKKGKKEIRVRCKGRKEERIKIRRALMLLSFFERGSWALMLL